MGGIFIQLLITVLTIMCATDTLFVANGYIVSFLRGRLDQYIVTYHTITTREISHPLTKETNTRRGSRLTVYKEDRREKTELSLTTKTTDTRRRSCLIDYKENRQEKTVLSH